MRIRIKIVKNTADPAKDLEIASSLRRDLWAHSPVEIDVDDPAVGTRRDRDGAAFFEFDTSYPEEVERVIRDYGYGDFVTIETIAESTAGQV